MATVYVLGAHGFVGGHVCARRELGIRGHAVTVVPAPSALDITDAAAVAAALVDARPDYVLHLAALTFVPQSFAEPHRTFAVNLNGTLNVLLALRAMGFAGRMLYVSTGDVYGLVEPEALPVSEREIPRPRSPYAVSKLAAEALCLQWCATEGLDVVVARPFNHIGSGQSERFAVSGFAKQIVTIARGGHPPVLDVGDLDVTRDFCDVRDVLAAYGALLGEGRRGTVYNVCSGVERSLRSVLDELLALAGIEVEVRTDALRVRPTEQRRVCGSFARIRRDTGWAPTIAFADSLRSTLDYWEARS